MKLMPVLFVMSTLPAIALAQGATPDSAAVAPAVVAAPATPPPATPPPAKGPSRIYYGGELGLSFGDYTSISVRPLVGYLFSSRLSGGVKVGYQYVNDSRGVYDYTASNYGASVFGRFRLTPQIYATAEYAEINYEFQTGPNNSEREWVPFLYLGGGFVKQIGPKTSAYAEVTFDVLNDESSPYPAGEPHVTFGVGVGF